MGLLHLTLPFSLSVLLSTLVSYSNAFQCVNEFGHEVDWFIAMRLNPSKDPREYAVIDSNDSMNWRSTNEESIFGNLFDAVSPGDDHVIAWNDNPADNTTSTSTSYAHSKGLMAIERDGNTGFLLTHSIPEFPTITKKQIFYESPKGSVYG